MEKLSTSRGSLMRLSAEGIIPNEALIKLEAFSRLQPGWHYGSGGPPSPYVVSIAKTLISFSLYRGFEKIDVFPGKCGDVTVALYLNEQDHSFQIHSDLSIRYSIEDDLESEPTAMLMGEVLEKITKLGGSKWNSSTTFTFGTGTGRSNILGARPLKTPAMVAGFLPYSATAFALALGIFVHTPDYITPQSVRSHQSSGNLTTQYSLKVID